jgi:ABC-type Mn2+/Zn2+ transport system permease subunit
MANSAMGMEEVHHLVEGNVLAIGQDDLTRLCGALLPVSVFLIVGSRRLLFCTFDREMAATLGIRTRLWDVGYYLAFGVTAAVAVHAAGTLFVFAFLVLPGAAGVLLGRTGAATLVVAAVTAVAAAAAGFVASASAWDTPTGPTCAAAALALFLIAAVVAVIRRR